MRQKRVAFLAALALVVGLSMAFVGTSAAQSAPDCSTVSYSTDTDGALLVQNVDQLQCMNQSLGEDYRLANDIDASGTSSWNGGEGFVPVGNSTDPFTGSLDGDGYAVTGLYINRSDNYQGLFGYMDGAVVRDLGLEDVYVESSGLSAPLGGEANRTEVYDTYTTGEVYDNGGCCTAGLIAEAVVQGSDTVGNIIKNVSTDVYVDASGCCGGGLFEWFQGGTIEDSHAEGDVFGSNSCCSGGLASFIQADGGAPVKVRNSYATGDVNDAGCCAGGFAGFIYVGSPVSPEPSVTVEDSYATGKVNASFDGGGCCNGGFAGYIFDTAVVRDSYATGDVDGNCCNGGFAGFIEESSVVNDSYATGDVNGTNCCAGGFVGVAEDNSLIERSVARGDANETGSGQAGGFAGRVRENANITESYATGNSFSNENAVGGFVGNFRGGEINKSYARGDATGNDSVGGFAGRHAGDSIDEVYSTGIPTATGTGVTNVGGLVGKNDSGGPVTDSYWDEEASGTSVSAEGTPLTTSQMTGSDAPTNMLGFDFTNTWSTTGSYPILQNSPDLSFLFEDDLIDRRELGRGESDKALREGQGDRKFGRGTDRSRDSQERDTRRRDSGRSR